MRWLRENIFHNFKLKVLALAISLGLWALYTREPFAEVAYSVPISFVNVPAGLVISGDTPATVHVVIRGRTGLVSRVEANDLNFTIDLSQAQAGSDDIRVRRRMVRVPYGTDVLAVTPSQFHVVLVTNASRLPAAE